MGYTHYWSLVNKPEQLTAARYEALAEKVNLLFAQAKQQQIALGDALGRQGSKPLIDVGTIVFNGVEPLDYETFEFDAFSGGPKFCKTGERPYDAVVAAVLICAKDVYRWDLTVSSDGRWDEPEWKAARALYEATFGVEPKCPFS